MASAELETIAAAELAVKLALESKLRPQIKRAFASVATDLAITWASRQTIPDMRQHQQAVEVILLEHYKACGRAFGGTIRARLGKGMIYRAESKVADPLDAQIAGNLLEWAKAHARQQSLYIADTTSQDLAKITSAVASEPVPIGSPAPTATQQAARIVRDFNASVSERIEAIVITETNAATENAKQVEAQELYKVNRLPGAAKKTWVARLDNRTREEHMRAEGQTREFDGLYTVWGEQLSYPGDTSHGASVKNVIHCRCSSILTW